MDPFVSYWRGKMRVLRYIGIAFVLVCLLLGVILANRGYPGAPIAVFLVMYPMAIWGSKILLFHDTPTVFFLRSISFVLFLCGTVDLVIWLVRGFGGSRGQPHRTLPQPRCALPGKMPSCALPGKMPSDAHLPFVPPPLPASVRFGYLLATTTGRTASKLNTLT